LPHETIRVNVAGDVEAGRAESARGRVTPGAARARLDAEIDRLASEGIVPGGAAAIVTAHGVAYRRVFGARAIEPRREPADAATFWDLASLTKPLVTASIALVLRARGELHIGEPA
jgi:CubicO group peptidase (beta-lactamase class C family)